MLYISWVLSPSQAGDHGEGNDKDSTPEKADLTAGARDEDVTPDKAAAAAAAAATAATAGALGNWKLVGMPLLFLNYIMLLAAIVLMFFANAYSMWFADPYPLKAADIYGVAGFYTIVLIVTFVLFIVGGIAAFCLSTREPITCCGSRKNRVAAASS